MKNPSLELVCALAVCGAVLASCSSDEPITSAPPPQIDAALPPPMEKLDAAPASSDTGLGEDAAADAPAAEVGTSDAADDASQDGAGAGAGADAGEDTAADARTCGAMGQAPCPGALCAGGLCLSDMNRCIGPGMECGQMSGTCNANGSCGAGGQTCGRENQPCCGIGEPPQGAFCSEPGTFCTGNGANRTCRACGDKGEPCCGDPGTCRTGACPGNGNNRTCP